MEYSEEDLWLEIGSGGIAISPNLLWLHGPDADLDKIILWHVNKMFIEQFIRDNLNDLNSETMFELNKRITECEFNLQESWGFPRNINFHKFWERPGCSCPRLDNEDLYPSGPYYRCSDCQLHSVSISKGVKNEKSN